jgi:hypothetical protein
MRGEIAPALSPEVASRNQVAGPGKMASTTAISSGIAANGAPPRSMCRGHVPQRAGLDKAAPAA